MRTPIIVNSIGETRDGFWKAVFHFLFLTSAMKIWNVSSTESCSFDGTGVGVISHFSSLGVVGKDGFG